MCLLLSVSSCFNQNFFIFHCAKNTGSIVFQGKVFILFNCTLQNAPMILLIHVRNLQLLMTEIFETKSHLNSSFMEDFFQERNMNYNLRHGNDAQIPKVRTTSFEVVTIAYLGSGLWQLLPQEIKQSNTLLYSKNELNV